MLDGLTAYGPDVWLGPAAKRIRSFWVAKHPSVGFVFKGPDSPFQISRQRQALTPIEEHRQNNWPIEYNLYGKTHGFVFLQYCQQCHG